jgi:ankyrin repeat protein
MLILLQGEETPLWGASAEERLDTVEALLDRGAEVNQRNDVRT